jgi:tripartite ATP-independent transporter DctP family solute receptor
MSQPGLFTRRRLLGVAAGSACGGACAAGAQDPMLLRVGIGLPADSVQGRAVRDFAQRVERHTRGGVRIELHAGGALGNDVSMVQSLRDGTLEMTVPDSSTLAQLNAAFSAINYPFTFFDEKEADTLLDGVWGQRQLDSLVPHGLVGLAYWENGFRHITNNLRPIAQAADFRGVRLRTMQNEMLADSFRRLGFEAVPMPFPQVYEALRQQVVDGQENPLPTILGSRLYEVQKYLTLSRHVYSAFVLLVSRRHWELLGADQRLALRRSAAESRELQRRWNREAAGQALAALRERGMQVSSIPREDAERIRHRLRDVFDQYNRRIGTSEVIELYVELGRLRTGSR